MRLTRPQGTVIHAPKVLHRIDTNQRPAFQSSKAQVCGYDTPVVSELKNEVRPEVLRAATNHSLLFVPLDFAIGLFLIFGLDSTFTSPPSLPWWLGGLLLGAGFAAAGTGAFRGLLLLGARPFSPAVVVITEEGMECDLPARSYRGKVESARHVIIPWDSIQTITPPGLVHYGSLRYKPTTPIRTRGGSPRRYTYLVLTGDNCRIAQESWSKWRQLQTSDVPLSRT